MPRTIDNLGNEASERYANDQNTDLTYIKKAGSIPPQTEIDVFTPFFSGELEALLSTYTGHIAWALFFPPKAYKEQRKRLFTFQITPTIGLEGKWETQVLKALEKLQSKLNEGENKEKKIITSLVKMINDLNKSMVEINAKRSQYMKN